MRLPAIGAKFTQYTAEFEAGGFLPGCETQRFVYVIEGTLQGMKAGDYAWFPAGVELTAESIARAAVIEKAYQPLPGTSMPTCIRGSESLIAPTPLMGDPDLEVRTLIPADPAFDLAVNTMTFRPGATLPMVEIHVMEHGLADARRRGDLSPGRPLVPGRKGRFHLDGALAAPMVRRTGQSADEIPHLQRLESLSFGTAN